MASYVVSEKPKTLTFHINTTADTNDRTPVYLLVKTTDFSHFLMDDYGQIASQIAHPDEKSPCLLSLCMIPGTSKTLEIEPPEENVIAFYALFTNPGKDWKYLINTEESFTKVEVLLGAHEIESVHIE